MSLHVYAELPTSHCRHFEVGRRRVRLRLLGDNCQPCPYLERWMIRLASSFRFEDAPLC